MLIWNARILCRVAFSRYSLDAFRNSKILQVACHKLTQRNIAPFSGSEFGIYVWSQILIYAQKEFFLNPAYGRHWNRSCDLIQGQWKAMKAGEGTGGVGREGGPMRGLEQIIWPQGQWQALKKIASDGTNIQTSWRTWWLYDWIGPVGPIQWNSVTCNVSPVTCHLSPVNVHLSLVNFKILPWRTHR